MNSRTVRRMAAAIGVSAVVTMGAGVVAAGSVQASGTLPTPEHYGGPVNTTIVDPSTMAGLPMGATVTPTSGAPDGTVQGG